MKPKYCLPIIKTGQAEVLTAIHDNLADYSYFEVWLDYIHNLDEAFINHLIAMCGDKLLLLFRRKNLEPIKMDLAKRLHILNMLINTSSMIDLDVTTQVDELDYICEHDLSLKIILSYHNYEHTPDSVQLTEIIATMKGYHPHMYKLSTLCDSQEDALRLLQLLLRLKGQNLRAIISGMGEQGAMVKVFGALWGNEMTFAPVTASEQSAPGQLTRQQLEIIFKELESEHAW